MLIQGETGTGKELIARALHELSPRRSAPFIAINCGGLSYTIGQSELFGHERGAFTDAKSTRHGVFELAHKGSLFLDEVGDLELPQQNWLLRTIEEKGFRRIGGEKEIKIDVRIIAATNKDLKEEVKKGNFRADLFWRLTSLIIQVPPLRDRPNDILLLARFFLKKLEKDIGPKYLTPDAEDLLLSHMWPGNIRELYNTLLNAGLCVNGQKICGSDLCLDISLDYISDRDKEERQRLLNILKGVKWNISKAARMLDIPRTTLRERLKKMNLLPRK